MDSIILLGGSGTRLNAGTNKILLPLNNLPLFLYSYNNLKKISEKVILVIRKEDEEYIKKYTDKDTILVYGGSERYLSVLNGISKTSSKYVLIHDGARPFIKEENILNLMNNIEQYDAGMVCSKEINTVYKLDDNNLDTLNRNEIICAETPQIVNRGLFLEALKFCIDNDIKVTDDISVILKYKKKAAIKLEYTSGENFKITNKKDYELAKVLIDND